MKERISWGSLVLMIVLFMGGVFVPDIVKAEQWAKEDVPIDKVWTVTFNTEMDPSSIDSETIYIKDSEGDKLDNLDIILDYSRKEVRVDYGAAYEYGETYQLVVTSGVRSAEGAAAVDSSSMQFTVEENTNKSTADIIREVDHKVVTIEVATLEGGSQGSGVVVGEGLILTNHHVVNGMERGIVRFTDGTEYEVEGIVEMDAEKDLALVKTSQSFNVSPVKIGTSNGLSKGDRVVAIGSPKGLSNTASEGSVSAFRDFEGVRVIQTDAEIDHGSSGGGLFDSTAALVGITSSGLDSNAALNFAVAIDEALVWENYFAMDYSSIPINHPLNQPEPQPAPEPEPDPGDSFYYGDVYLGMSRAEVKSAEYGTLVKETSDKLFYTDKGFYGHHVNVGYLFENDQLVEMFIMLSGVDDYSFSDLEWLFNDLYTNMEQDIGPADKLDLDWYNDAEGYWLKAYWDGDPQLLMSVTVEESDYTSIASILISKVR